MPRIYISYARDDALLAEAARLIAPRLAREAAGIDVTTGPGDGPVPFNPAVLHDILRDTALLIVLIGPATAEPSAATREELTCAVATRLPIIPVLVNGAQLPSSPPWAELRSFQATSLDLRADHGEQLDRLARAALNVIGRPSRPMPAPAPAARRHFLSALELDALRQLAIGIPTPLPASIAALVGQGSAGVTVAMASPPPPQLPAPPARKPTGLLLSSAAVLLLGSTAYLALNTAYLAFNIGRPDDRRVAHEHTYEPERPIPAKSIYEPHWASEFGGPGRKPGGFAPLPWSNAGPEHQQGMLPAPFFAMAAAAALPPPPPSRAPTETVDVSAFAPNEGRAGDEVLVQVYLHRPRQLARVERGAVKKDPDTRHRETATLETEITRGQKIGIELACPALQIAEPRQELAWRGDPAVCSFVVGLPAAAAGRSHTLRVRVLIEDMPIGRLTFALRVAAAEAALDDEPRIQGIDATRYRYAFLSYSSADRIEVLKNARLLRALGIDFFQDLLSLEAGQRFEPKLFAEIDRCDLFLLFWSKTAAASDWVIRETEHALERQTSSRAEAPEIKPIILEGPPVPRPPPALEHMHFNDYINYVIAGIESAQRPS